MFYAIYNFNKGWHVVRKIKPFDSYDMGKQIDEDDVVVHIESPTQNKRKWTDEVIYILWTDKHDFFYTKLLHMIPIWDWGLWDLYILLNIDKSYC